MWRRSWTAFLLSGFVVAMLSASGAFGQTKLRTVATAAELSGALEATAQRVSPAVVEIFTTSYVPGNGLVPTTADLVTTQRASGSGIIVDPDGYIVTNAHVVNGAQRLRVELAIPPTGRSILATTSRSVSGQIVGIDLETDLAVIKIDQQNLPVLRFGDSDELKTGQVVLAFGSPMGLRNSVSLGIVSSAARQLSALGFQLTAQTDLAESRQLIATPHK